jgi:hypothetical protein
MYDSLLVGKSHNMPIVLRELNGGAPMPTRNVVLTERQESLIEALVQSGRY